MPNPLHPTRRRLLAASAFAATGLSLGFEQALAQQPTPQCHDGDEPTVRQTEGPYFKPSSPQRTDLVEPNSKARLVEISGQVLTRACRPVPAPDRSLAFRRARCLRQRGLPLSRASVHRCRGPLPLSHYPAGALHRPHPPLSRQGAGGGPGGADHAALFPRRRGGEPPRRAVSPGAADARRRCRRRPRGAVRFHPRHAVSAFSDSAMHRRGGFGAAPSPALAGRGLGRGGMSGTLALQPAFPSAAKRYRTPGRYPGR